MIYDRLYGYIRNCPYPELELQLISVRGERVVWWRRYAPADPASAEYLREADHIEETYNRTMEAQKRISDGGEPGEMMSAYSLTYKNCEHIVRAYSMRAALIVQFPWMTWDEWSQVTIRVLELAPGSKAQDGLPF
jgi:hypothetical protein